MPAESHALMDGALHVYRRTNSRFWQCATFLSGTNHRRTTKETNLAAAKDFARDWYMERCVEDRQRRRARALGLDDPVQPSFAGTGALLPARRRPAAKGPTFAQAAEAFLDEYTVLIADERNAKYVEQKSAQVRLHLNPYLGSKPVAAISAGVIQDYRIHRQTSRLDLAGKPKRPSRSTMHTEMVTLRQILKTANRKGWIEAIPDMSVPYKKSGKVEHRAWFSPDEYRLLYEATRERAKNPPKERWRDVCETFHDYVLFMGNTGLRPDECSRLELRDIVVVRDEATGQRILEISVRGKRGVGVCKSMPGAVLPFERVRKRKGLKPTERVFGKVPRELMNTVLDELGMKHDREGHVRSCYSLRHTYICLRLLEGADIYQVAKNCRTSVEMIEKYYARHLETNIDVSAINVRRPRPARPARATARPKPTLDVAPRRAAS